MLLPKVPIVVQFTSPLKVSLVVAPSLELFSVKGRARILTEPVMRPPHVVRRVHQFAIVAARGKGGLACFSAWIARVMLGRRFPVQITKVAKLVLLQFPAEPSVALILVSVILRLSSITRSIGFRLGWLFKRRGARSLALEQFPLLT
jgi:hypothetical protein